MHKQSTPIVLIVATFLAGSVVAQTSAPPAMYQPKQGVKAPAVASLLLPADAPAMAIVLTEPTTAEKARPVPKAATSSTKDAVNAKRRRAIGFARNLPAATDAISLSTLQWTALPTGGRAARITVTSPGAAALRVALELHDAPAGFQVRFAGSSGGTVFGPYIADGGWTQEGYGALPGTAVMCTPPA